MLAAVGQGAVDLIGDNEEVMLDDQINDGFQILCRHDGSCRIVGEGQNQELGPGRDRCFQQLRRQLELVFLLQGQGNRNTVCQHNAGQVGHIAWLGDDDLIARIQHGPHGDIDGLGTADSDHDLMLGIIVDIAFAGQIGCNLFLELHQTGIGRIEGSALFQGIDTLITDMPWCIKIRFAHTEGDDLRVIHLGDDVKKLTDTGGLDLLYLLT